MKEMDLFEGLKWMHDNQGKTLDMLDPEDGSVCYCRMLGSSLEWQHPNQKWYGWSPTWSKQYRFRLPERKLPELPEGDVWVMKDGQPCGIRAGCGIFHPIITTDLAYHRDQTLRCKALIEEFETRTGEQK